MSRAVRFSSTGDPSVLEIVEVDEPHANDGQVRIAVRAAALNPYDSKVRRGDIPTRLPSGQGAEFAGVVDEVGAGVTSIKIGDDVFGWVMAAAQADYVVVAEKNLARKPVELDWATAAGLGTVANTAWRATSALALTASDTVLVTGAAGGVGMLSAQFALAVGARVVGTARESAHGFLRELGVVPVDYGPGVRERLTAAAPDGYSAALDHVGRESVELALSLGIPASRINSIADYAGAAEFGISTVGGGGKTSDQLEGFARDIVEGRWVLPVRATFDLNDVESAYHELDTGHGIGKVVLTISQ